MMILADVFPVFCPRVLVSSSNQWPRATRGSDQRQGKMWSGNDRHFVSSPEHIQRHFPNLMPIPDSYFLGRANPYRTVAFPESSFKNRTQSKSQLSDTFRDVQTRSTGDLLKMPPLLTPDRKEGTSVSGRSVNHFLQASPAFQSSPTIRESLLRSRDGPSFPLHPFKTGPDLTDKITLAQVGRKYHGSLIRSAGYGTSKAMSIYRKHNPSTMNKKLYTCPQCKYVTDRKNNLKRHISTMHQDSSKVLECCGMVFRSKALLRDHVSLFHRAGYRCQYCGRNFCRKALLRRHLTVHSGQKDFTCPQCGYATSHKSNLERHRKIHDRKYSPDGEDFSDEGESNQVSQYPDGISSPSTSGSETSPDSSPVKYTSVGDVKDDGHVVTSRTASRRSVMPDRILETCQVGESTQLLSQRLKYFPDCPETSSSEMLNTGTSLEWMRAVSSPFVVTQNSCVPTMAPETIFQMEERHTQPTQPLDEPNIPKTEYLAGKAVNFGIRKLSNRLFLTPYKCNDCFAVFSSQYQFSGHSCKPRKPVAMSPPISVLGRRVQKVEVSSEKAHQASDLDSNFNSCENSLSHSSETSFAKFNNGQDGKGMCDSDKTGSECVPESSKSDADGKADCKADTNM